MGRWTLRPLCLLVDIVRWRYNRKIETRVVNIVTTPRNYAVIMRIFVFTANYELLVSRKSHIHDHPNRNCILPKIM
jgi:hypothetical protein